MVARDGLILWENEATGSRKVFKYLPGLRDTIKKTKIAAKVKKCKNTAFYRIFLYILFGVSRWGHIYIYIGVGGMGAALLNNIGVRGCPNGIFHPWA